MDNHSIVVKPERARSKTSHAALPTALALYLQVSKGVERAPDHKSRCS
jgi:hypothetical protein